MRRCPFRFLVFLIFIVFKKHGIIIYSNPYILYYISIFKSIAIWVIIICNMIDQSWCFFKNFFLSCSFFCLLRPALFLTILCILFLVNHFTSNTFFLLRSMFLSLSHLESFFHIYTVLSMFAISYSKSTYFSFIYTIASPFKE